MIGAPSTMGEREVMEWKFHSRRASPGPCENFGSSPGFGSLYRSLHFSLSACPKFSFRCFIFIFFFRFSASTSSHTPSFRSDFVFRGRGRSSLDTERFACGDRTEERTKRGRTVKIERVVRNMKNESMSVGARDDGGLNFFCW